MTSRIAFLVLLGTVVGVAGGCQAYSLSVTNKEPFQPLPIYGEWWAATEVCSGRTGDLTRIEWFTATSITGDAVVARGVWTPPHQIILVRGYEESELTVRHEMLHDLLEGDSDHTSTTWTTCDLIPR
jgi:hypothetical protein